MNLTAILFWLLCLSIVINIFQGVLLMVEKEKVR